MTLVLLQDQSWSFAAAWSGEASFRQTSRGIEFCARCTFVARREEEIMDDPVVQCFDVARDIE